MTPRIGFIPWFIGVTSRGRIEDREAASVDLGLKPCQPPRPLEVVNGRVDRNRRRWSPRDAPRVALSRRPGGGPYRDTHGGIAPRRAEAGARVAPDRRRFRAACALRTGVRVREVVPHEGRRALPERGGTESSLDLLAPERLGAHGASRSGAPRAPHPRGRDLARSLSGRSGTAPRHRPRDHRGGTLEGGPARGRGPRRREPALHGPPRRGPPRRALRALAKARLELRGEPGQRPCPLHEWRAFACIGPLRDRPWSGS